MFCSLGSRFPLIHVELDSGRLRWPEAITDSASSESISPDSMLKLQVGDLASAEQLQLPLCTVCNSGRPINGPRATQCVICRQSRRKGNKNARGSMDNRGNTQKGATRVEAGKKSRGNKTARGSMDNRGNTQKGATKVEAGKKSRGNKTGRRRAPL